MELIVSTVSVRIIGTRGECRSVKVPIMFKENIYIQICDYIYLISIHSGESYTLAIRIVTSL